MKYVIDIQEDHNEYKVMIFRKNEGKKKLIGVPFKGTYEEVIRVIDSLRFAFDFGRSAAVEDIKDCISHLPWETKDISPDEDTLMMGYRIED